MAGPHSAEYAPGRYWLEPQQAAFERAEAGIFEVVLDLVAQV